MTIAPALTRSHTFVRSFPLEHIAVRSDGLGRTVEAYAAVFASPIECDGFYYVDQDPFDDEFGPHLEQIGRTAFDKTLSERGLDFQVLFNHGMDIYHNPAERYSMPLGTPIELKVDTKGLWTVTRYAATPLSDEVIELINNGSIRGQSFRGQVMDAKLTPRKSETDLDLVEFTTIALKEYGPCTFPAYPEASIEQVRAEELLARLDTLSPKERELLIQRLQSTPAEAATRTSSDGPGAAGDTHELAASAPAQGPSLERLCNEQAQRRRTSA